MSHRRFRSTTLSRRTTLLVTAKSLRESALGYADLLFRGNKAKTDLLTHLIV